VSKKATIATVQILVDEADAIAATDGFSEMLSHNDWVIDWTYLQIGGQFMYPAEKIIPDDYEEGEAFVR
jgi:hypothetical protein